MGFGKSERSKNKFIENYSIKTNVLIINMSEEGDKHSQKNTVSSQY